MRQRNVLSFLLYFNSYLLFGCSNDQNLFSSQLGIFQARKRGILDMDIMYEKSVEQLKIVLTSPVRGMELSSKLLLQDHAHQVMVQGMD